MIFITGATGFMGSYLAKNLLQKGAKIRALKRSDSRFTLLGDYATRIEWVEGDLLDIASLESALEGVEKIYHCAGILHNNPGRGDKVLLVNPEGTANLYHAALYRKVKRALHVSSTIALGLPVSGAEIDETYYAAGSKRRWDYFESKRHGELEAWRAQAEGLEVVVVNPAAVVGAGFWHHGPLSAFGAVYDGLSFYPPGSNGFIDVRDAAEAMVRLMESDRNGERFIMTGCNLPLKEYFSLVACALHLTPPVYPMNPLISGIAWRYEVLRAALKKEAPVFTRNDMNVARVSFNYSNAKLKSATGMEFRPMKDTVRETAECFLKSKAKGLNYGVFA